jgi:2-polyprenyl-3-methyl-5-hydroxy-6-metoxy-1,4-benzoquinol methylase
MKKVQASHFFDQHDQMEIYSAVYGSSNFEKQYPANAQRLAIFLTLLDQIQPSHVVDAGCGNGLPMITMLRKGFNVTGYDLSTTQVAAAQKNLADSNFGTNLVSVGDFECPDHIEENSVDCITGMGTFYYSSNLLTVLQAHTKKISPGGSIIFSLRNSLFSLATLNRYTSEFLSELYAINELSETEQDEFFRLCSYDDFGKDEKKFLTIDDHNVSSTSSNPLSIKEDLLMPCDLELVDIYFYHYHYLPPSFEHKDPVGFRRKSWEIEDPKSWTGFFKASCFIVHARKPD